MKLLLSRLGSRSPRDVQAAATLLTRRLGVYLIVGLAAVCGQPARADMFTVSGIEIAATAESAVDAKQVAIAEGQARAFARLARRLIAPEEAGLLATPDPETLQSVVAGYSLDNERTSASEYLAELTVRFNADAIEFLLSKSNIRLAVEQAPPALIVPVLWRDGTATIWGRSNPWRATWERLDLDNRLVPALLPLGDAADELADPQRLAVADPNALALLAGRYGVELALVAVVAYDPGQNRIEAALAGTGPYGAIDLREVGILEEGGEEQAMAEIASALLQRLDAEWRRIALADPSRLARQEVAIGVPFSSLQEWVAIRGRLETAPGIDSVDVRSLNAGEARIVITYTGGFRELAGALELQGLYLYDDGANWVIRTN